MSQRELGALTRPATVQHVSGKDVALGGRVKARYRASSLGPARTQWYAGEVVAVHEDGTVAVRYEDGDYEDGVSRVYLRPLQNADPT